MPENPIDLETAEASITTATVTIKTLRVNSRQLTLATFRQLPTRRLVDEEEIKLLGTVWGWVNYKPPGESEHQTQFVVQFGDKLCRSPFLVRILPGEDWTDELFEMRGAYRQTVGASIVLGLLERPDELKLPWMTADFHYDPREMQFKVHTRPPFSSFIFALRKEEWAGMEEALRLLMRIERPTEFVKWVGDERIEIAADESKKTAIADLKQMLAMRGFDVSKPATWWQERLDSQAAEAADYINRWNALMEELKSYEQLYIAT